jgi:hypothetical protein
MELDEYRQGLVLIPPSLPPLLMEDFANVDALMVVASRVRRFQTPSKDPSRRDGDGDKEPNDDDDDSMHTTSRPGLIVKGMRDKYTHTRLRTPGSSPLSPVYASSSTTTSTSTVILTPP